MVDRIKHSRLTWPLAVPAVAVLCLALVGSGRAETAVVLPAPATPAASDSSASEKIVLAGGCFWGIQAVYQHVDGVLGAVSGYAGGARETASYRLVSTGRTGHAESVEITFDPHVVSYGQILQIFFSVAHDPTQLDRQGPDTGTQYRSEIFTTTEEQARIARDYVAQLDRAGVFKRRIVTVVAPLEGFYPAEPHHQDYATRHPDDAYIVYNDRPKVENLSRLFPGLYRAKPRLVSEAGG